MPNFYQTPTSYSQAPFLYSSAPSSILTRTAYSESSIIECAEQMYVLLGWTRSTSLILKPLIEKGFDTKELEAKVFIKLLFILEQKSKIERFSAFFKDKLSSYFHLLSKRFPELKFQDYFFNYGPVPMIPLGAPEDLIKKVKESQFSVGLSLLAIIHLLKTEIPKYQVTPGRQEFVSNVDLVQFENLQDYMERVQLSYSGKTMAIILQHPKPSMHVSLILMQVKFNQLNFIIIESTGGSYTPLNQLQENKMPESPMLQGVIDCIAHKFVRRFPLKISYFSTRRQRDVTSCPVFVLSDLFACFNVDMFEYINAVENYFPDRIIKEKVPVENFVLQAVPTYPPLLLLTQSVQFFVGHSKSKNPGDEFDEKLAYFFVRKDLFESELKKSIMISGTGKSVNFKTQMLFLDFAKKITADLLNSSIHG